MGGTYQQPIANWGEPSNMHRENDFLYSKTATNIIEANVNSVRDYKANIYEIQKKHIQKIHQKIMSIKPVYREQGISEI